MNNDLVVKNIFYYCSDEDRDNLKRVNKMWYKNKNYIDPTQFMKQCAKQGNWEKYHIPADVKGVDSIIEFTLADNPDFSDLNALTKQIINIP